MLVKFQTNYVFFLICAPAFLCRENTKANEKYLIAISQCAHWSVWQPLYLSPILFHSGTWTNISSRKGKCQLNWSWNLSNTTESRFWTCMSKWENAIISHNRRRHFKHSKHCSFCRLFYWCGVMWIGCLQKLHLSRWAGCTSCHRGKGVFVAWWLSPWCSWFVCSLIPSDECADWQVFCNEYAPNFIFDFWNNKYNIK